MGNILLSISLLTRTEDKHVTLEGSEFEIRYGKTVVATAKRVGNKHYRIKPNARMKLSTKVYVNMKVIITKKKVKLIITKVKVRLKERWA